MTKEKTAKKIISISLFFIGIASVFLVYISKIEPPSVFYPYLDVIIGVIVGGMIFLIALNLMFREDIEAKHKEELLKLELEKKDLVLQKLQAELQYLKSKK